VDLHRGGERLDEDGREPAPTARYVEFDRPVSHDVGVERVVPRVRRDVDRERQPVLVPESGEVRRRTLRRPDSPHPVRDEPEFGPGERPPDRRHAPRDGGRLPVQSGGVEPGGRRVQLRVVPAELSLADPGSEDGVGDAREPSLGVDGVPLQFEADREPAVEPVGGERRPERVGLIPYATPELDLRRRSSRPPDGGYGIHTVL